MTSRKQLIEEILSNFSAIRKKAFSAGFYLHQKNQVTPSQWQLLHLISHHDGIGVKEIAEHLGVTSSAATQMIDSLVDDGLLVRANSPEDRRAIKIKISEKSKKHMKLMREKVFKHLATIFETLTDKELVQYNKINKKIIDRALRSKVED